jgi:hypothetical protein
VLDFGIAKLAPSVVGTNSPRTQTGALLGTPEYMAPEQVSGGVIDGRTDLYACGVMLYELVTGQRPFVSGNLFALMRAHVEDQPVPPRALRADVPVGLEEVILRALAKDPAARFVDADDMANALRQVSADLPAAQWQSVAPQRAESTSPSNTGRGISAPPGRTPGALAPQAATPTPSAPTPTPRKRSAAPWIALGIAVAGGAVATAIVVTRGDDDGPRLPPSIQVGAGVTAGGVVVPQTRPTPPTDLEAADRPAADPSAALLAAPSAGDDHADGSAGSGSGAATLNDALREMNAAMADMSPEDRAVVGSFMKDPAAALGDLSKLLEGFGAGIGALAGSATSPAAGSGSAAAGSAPAPAWTSLRMLAPPRNPKRVDPSAQVRAVRDALIGEVPDVVPTSLSVMGVGRSGHIDLTAASTKTGMISLTLTSPRDHGCMTFALSRASAMLAGAPPEACTAPLPWPRCTVAEIRKRADAAGAGDQPLMITYSATGGPAQWMTMGTGGAIFMQGFPDDCEAAS